MAAATVSPLVVDLLPLPLSLRSCRDPGRARDRPAVLDLVGWTPRSEVSPQIGSCSSSFLAALEIAFDARATATWDRGPRRSHCAGAGGHRGARLRRRRPGRHARCWWPSSLPPLPSGSWWGAQGRGSDRHCLRAARECRERRRRLRHGVMLSLFFSSSGPRREQRDVCWAFFFLLVVVLGLVPLGRARSGAILAAVGAHARTSAQISVRIAFVLLCSPCWFLRRALWLEVVFGAFMAGPWSPGRPRQGGGETGLQEKLEGSGSGSSFPVPSCRRG